MKARIPVSKEMRKSLEQEARIVIQKEIENQRNDFTRKLFKLMCYVLYEEYHFNDRCKNVMAAIQKLSEKADTDEVFWEHVDKIVIDYLKIPFKRDYTR